MNIYFPEKESVFLSVPKCASTSAQCTFLFMDPKHNIRLIYTGKNIPFTAIDIFRGAWKRQGWNDTISGAATSFIRGFQDRKRDTQTRLYHRTDNNELTRIWPDIKSKSTFAIIRNPWDRMVSLYFWTMRQNDILVDYRNEHGQIPFHKFVPMAIERNFFQEMNIETQVHSRPQVDFIFEDTTIMSFENLYNDWNKIRKLWGCGDINKFITNVSPERSMRNKLSYIEFYRQNGSKGESKLKNLVGDFWEKDVKRFNYEY